MPKPRYTPAVRISRTAVSTACVAVLLAACSGSGADEVPSSTTITTLAPVSTTAASTTSTSTSTTTSTTVASTTTLGPQNPSPLNGTDVADPTSLQRRAIAVKVDNHPKARPQSGIQEADVVYELLVEGGRDLRCG